MKRNKCPICESNICEELIVDLVQCLKCSHIFKKNMEIDDTIDIKRLHKYPHNIVSFLRSLIEKIDFEKEIEFKFPSMILYTMELKPNDFYHFKTNHYFNQMGIVILMERCGLKIIKQENIWEENMCLTTIIAKKEKVL